MIPKKHAPQGYDPKTAIPISQPANTIITPAWLSRSALSVAPDLIGCTLIRQFPEGQQRRGLIVETEAYEEGDPACHAYRKRTDRNTVMFGPAGQVYVYLIYGMYHCVNIVTDRDNFASAVLIRALLMEPSSRESYQSAYQSTYQSTPQNRPQEKPHRIAAGPGKLCRVMAIDRTLNNTSLVPSQALWLEHRSSSWQAALAQGTHQLVQTTRIGLSQGVDLPWRWYLKDSPAISKI